MCKKILGWFFIKKSADALLGDKYRINRMDNWWEILAIPGVFVIMLVFLALKYDPKEGIVDAILWTFFYLGMVIVLLAILGLPIYKVAQLVYFNRYFVKKGKIKEDIKEYLGIYFGPLPRQIMSLGVVPIIFGIVGIVISYEKVVPRFRDINILWALIVAGGLTETLAFFFGSIFPESEVEELGKRVPIKEGQFPTKFEGEIKDKGKIEGALK